MTRLVKNLTAAMKNEWGAWIGWIFWVLLVLIFLLLAAWEFGLLGSSSVRNLLGVLWVLLLLVAGGVSLLFGAAMIAPLIEAVKNRTREKLRWDDWAALVAGALFGLFVTVGPVLGLLLFWLGWRVPVPAPNPKWLFFA